MKKHFLSILFACLMLFGFGVVANATTLYVSEGHYQLPGVFGFGYGLDSSVELTAALDTAMGGSGLNRCYAKP